MTLFKKYALLFLIPLLAFTSHKYYISLTQIDYRAQNQTLQITMRLFIDDFEKSLVTNYKKDFNLDTPQEFDKTDDFVAYYLINHFKVVVNGKLLYFKYLGKEYEQDMMYLYLEIDSVSTIKSIGIENTILLNEFEDQQNIIKLKIKDGIKTMLLSRSNDKDLLNF